jgi:hypothetical protein
VDAPPSSLHNTIKMRKILALFDAQLCLSDPNQAMIDANHVMIDSNQIMIDVRAPICNVLNDMEIPHCGF